MGWFTRLTNKTSAEHEFMARSIDITYNDYMDQRNKANMLSYYSKKFLIERGLVPPPPDPREPIKEAHLPSQCAICYRGPCKLGTCDVPL